MKDAGPRRILIATDAWLPQVNGVVRTLTTVRGHLQRQGDTVEVIEPGCFATLPIPFYPEIPLACVLPHRVRDWLNRFRPDCIHIATEGPIGLMVRRECQSRGWPFTTSYHTRFPEYLYSLVGVPPGAAYGYLRWFHAGAAATMVATPSLEAELRERGFGPNLRRWSRGIDLTLFWPRPRPDCDWPRPILLYVGRVSKEKGIDDFLAIPHAGTKVIVGDGPARAELQRRYPEAQFLGYRSGEELAKTYALADLFVFPSKTDTFGLVLIEALACGVPVAAYPVTGPRDILTDDRCGALHPNLGEAIRLALLRGQREACVALAANYTWEQSTAQFRANLAPIRMS